MQCITMNTMATISLRVEDSMVGDLEEVEKSWQADRSEVVRRRVEGRACSGKVTSRQNFPR